jgi:hypothetical protein
MHAHVILLVTAEYEEQADEKVGAFLDDVPEHICDSYKVVAIRPLFICIMEVRERRQTINDALEIGRRWGKRSGNDIFAQRFTVDTNLFNVEHGDYSIPQNPTGWFAVTVDLHF